MKTSNCRCSHRQLVDAIVRFVALAFLLPPIARADSTNSATVLPTAGEAVKDGDVIYFRSDAPILQKSTGNDATTYCAPASSRFDVQSVTAATSKSSSTANSGNSPTTADTQLVVGSFSPAKQLFHFKALPWTFGSDTEKAGYVKSHQCNGDSDASKVADYNVPYKFTSSDFQNVRSQRMGFTWGGLIVPYKFYPSDHTFHTNSSAVGYVGYEGYFPGISLAGVVALGPGVSNSTASATSSSGGSATQSTASKGEFVTYTAATGGVVSFGGAMKLGLLLGSDWQGKGSGFAYEGKLWVSVSIGAGF